MAKRTYKPDAESVGDMNQTDVLDTSGSMPDDVPSPVATVTTKTTATKMVNESGEPKMYFGMTGGKTIPAGGSIPVPVDPTHLSFLSNHGFVLK